MRSGHSSVLKLYTFKFSDGFYIVIHTLFQLLIVLAAVTYLSAFFMVMINVFFRFLYHLNWIV